MFNSVFIVNVIVHVYVMATFLTIFYFTVAANQERNITKNQLNFLFNGTSTIGTFLNEDDKKMIQDLFDKNKSALLEEDQKVSEQNRKLRNYMTKILLIGSIVVILIVLTSYYYFNWNSSNLQYILISVGTGLVAVALTETAFLFLIPTNYLAINPNTIKLKLIKKIL